VRVDNKQLPVGWTVSTIEDIADVNPRLNKAGISDDLNVSFVPMPAVGAADGSIDVSGERLFGEVKKGFTPFQEGDVLFAKITPCMENGKMAIVPKVENGLGFGSTEFHVLRPKEGIDARYIYYYVSSKNFRGEAERYMSGAVGQKRVTTPYLKESKIPVAPPEQQKRIVAEIEKQFSRLDEAVTNLKRVKANLKRYKAAVLKAAVEGKLTEKWREEQAAKLEAQGSANAAGDTTSGAALETAEELLKRILTERRQKWEETELAKMKAKGKAPKDDKWKKKYKEPETLDTTNLPELPVGWNWVSMDSLIVWGPQNGLYLPKTAYKPGIAILRIDDYQDGHSREVAGLQQVNTTEENVERYGLERNDFVINRVNSPSHLGKCIVIKTRNLPSLFESNMMRLKLASSIRAEYVELYFHSKCGKTRLIDNAKWAVNQASINQGDVSMTAVPLPPENEQGLIINEVGSRFAIVTSIEAALEANMRRAERLRQSILSKAFSGQLNIENSSPVYISSKPAVASTLA
jgi:type I restriction enzyme S subunit